MEIHLQEVRAFIITFHTALRSGTRHEIQNFYEQQWKEMSAKFFTRDPWPTMREIALWVNNDRGFLLLYRILFFNHALTALRLSQGKPASFAMYAEAWNAYKEFFEFAADDAAATVMQLPNGWVFDIFSDCVLHFQTFYELRLQALGIGVTTPSDVAISVGSISEGDLAKAWATPEVLSALHRLAEKSDICTFLGSGRMPNALREMAGYYALVALGRFYSKLGDYSAAIEAMKPLNIFSSDGALFSTLPRAHASVQYYASFALLMARRYDDAVRILSKTLTWMQRNYSAFSSDRERSENDRVPALVKRNAEKMLGILALCHAVQPGMYIDEIIRRPLRERHSKTVEAIVSTAVSSDGGSERERAAAVEQLFLDSAPGYFSWSPLPLTAEGAAGYVEARDVQAYHLAALQADVAQRTENVSHVRSYLRLYTNIDISKLASYARMAEEDVRSLLTSIKLKASQNTEVGSVSADPIHFFLTGDTIAVEESRQAFNINGFFMRGIEQMARLSRDTESGRSHGGGKYNRHEGGGHGHGGAGRGEQRGDRGRVR